VRTDSSEGGTPPRPQQLEKMGAIVGPRFDTQEFAQRAQGEKWQQLTDEQQKAFTSLLIELVKQSYSDTLNCYAQESLVSFNQERIEGDQAAVQTRISSPAQSAPFSVVYQLHRKRKGG
jgi:ABC-type transporter MlaC component